MTSVGTAMQSTQIVRLLTDTKLKCRQFLRVRGHVWYFGSFRSISMLLKMFILKISCRYFTDLFSRKEFFF